MRIDEYIIQLLPTISSEEVPFGIKQLSDGRQALESRVSATLCIFLDDIVITSLGSRCPNIRVHCVPDSRQPK